MRDLKEMGLIGLYIDGERTNKAPAVWFHGAYAEGHPNMSWLILWRCPRELEHLSGRINLGHGYILERGLVSIGQVWRCSFGYDTTVERLEALKVYPPLQLTRRILERAPSNIMYEYGRKLKDAGMYPLCLEAEWGREPYEIKGEKRPSGWNKKESWITSTHDAYKVGPHWDKGLKSFNIHLGFSDLVALDLDIKKHPDYGKMTREEAKRVSLELVPKEWLESGCFKEFTKSGGLHLVWRWPQQQQKPDREMKEVLQTLYGYLKKEYGLEIPEVETPKGKRFPPLYEFFHCRLLRTYPTFGYEPIGDVQLLDAGEPPKSFQILYDYNTNNSDPVHVKEAPKPKPKPKQKYKGGQQHKHSKHHQTIEEKKNSMTWEGLFSQYGIVRTIEKGSGEKYDLRCRSLFSEDKRPSFFFQSNGDKDFKCHSTGKCGDILDIERFLRTGKEPNTI